MAHDDPTRARRRTAATNLKNGHRGVEQVKGQSEPSLETALRRCLLHSALWGAGGVVEVHVQSS